MAVHGTRSQGTQRILQLLLQTMSVLPESMLACSCSIPAQDFKETDVLVPCQVCREQSAAAHVLLQRVLLHLCKAPSRKPLQQAALCKEGTCLCKPQHVVAVVVDVHDVRCVHVCREIFAAGDSFLQVPRP